MKAQLTTARAIDAPNGNRDSFALAGTDTTGAEQNTEEQTSPVLILALDYVRGVVVQRG